jgi:hypothetical protein
MAVVKRRYGQYCGFSRALELIGERGLFSSFATFSSVPSVLAKFNAVFLGFQPTFLRPA